jgi:hypothetical protein
MIRTLEKSFQHQGVRPHIARAERHGARQLVQTDGRRARTNDEQSAWFRGAATAAREFAHVVERARFRGTRRRELRRIADDQIVAAPSARLIQTFHRIVALENDLPVSPFNAAHSAATSSAGALASTASTSLAPPRAAESATAPTKLYVSSTRRPRESSSMRARSGR